MTETAIAPSTAELPPVWPRVPRLAQGACYALARRRTVERLTARFGGAFCLDVPLWGRLVVVTDPALARRVFAAGPEDLGNIQPNLSRMFGPGSVFALDGAAHRDRRRLLTPPFHGRAMHRYEAIVEEETRRELACWPENTEFATAEPMMRITLNVMLRAIFGAAGAQLEGLRRGIPAWVALGSRLAVLPGAPARDIGPWRRLRRHRRDYDVIVGALIDAAAADPHLAERTDVLSLLLRGRYPDGTAMTRGEIADELLTLLVAGHETTATTLAWAFERISRHPPVLERLVAEAGTEHNEYRRAVICEVQRTRTVIDFAARHVYAPVFELGDYRIPCGASVAVSLSQLHANAAEFPDPWRFDPDRFLGRRPAVAGWVPFGGGTRRCVGAAFASMEMDVVLRTVARSVRIETTDRPGERVHNRGVAFAPARGGRITVHRRPTRPGPAAAGRATI